MLGLTGYFEIMSTPLGQKSSPEEIKKRFGLRVLDPRELLSEIGVIP